MIIEIVKDFGRKKMLDVCLDFKRAGAKKYMETKAWTMLLTLKMLHPH